MFCEIILEELDKSSKGLCHTNDNSDDITNLYTK